MASTPENGDSAPSSPAQKLELYSTAVKRHPSFQGNVRCPAAATAPRPKDSENREAGDDAGDADLLVENAPFSRVYHLVVTDADGHPQHDIPALAEPSGAVIVAVTADGRLGFVRHFRAAVARTPGAASFGFGARQQQEHQAEMLAARGHAALELARGLPNPRADGSGAMESAAEAAAREAREELGVPVRGVQLLGWTNFNTAIALNDIAVFAARLDAEAEGAEDDEVSIDPHEVIDGVVWLTVDEVANMVAGGEFRCGLTLSALSYFFCNQQRLLQWAAEK